MLIVPLACLLKRVGTFKYFIVFLYLLSSLTYANVSEWYFKVRDISCSQTQDYFHQDAIANRSELVQTFSEGDHQLDLSLDEHNFSNNDFEKWFYVQKTSQKIIYHAQKRKTQLEHALKDPQDFFYQNLKSQFILVANLEVQRLAIQNHISACSPWRFWNFLKRPQYNCDETSSQKEQQTHIDSTIQDIKDAHPLLSHQSFDYQKPFASTFPLVAKESIEQLNDKIKRHSDFVSAPYESVQLSTFLKNHRNLNEVVVINYQPENQIIQTNGQNKIATLDYGRCHIQQQFISSQTNQVLESFLKDTLLIASPFALKGKLTTLLKSAKAAHHMFKLKMARTGFIAAEGAYLAFEQADFHKSLNRCEGLNQELTHHLNIPNNLIDLKSECQELIDSLNSSRALALIGAGIGAKLSRLDITDIRLARVVSKGKESLLKSTRTAQAAVLRQLDEIERFTQSLTPQPPTMAMSADGAALDLEGIHYPSGTDERLKNRIDQKIAKNRRKQQSQPRGNPASTEEAKSVLDILELESCNQDCQEATNKLAEGINLLNKGKDNLSILRGLKSILDHNGVLYIKQPFRDFLSECLRVVSGTIHCNETQIQAIIKLVKEPSLQNKPDYFYERIINSLGINPSKYHLRRSTTLLAAQPLRNTGRIINEGYFRSDYRQRVLRNAGSDDQIKDLYKEEKATKLLKRFGYNVEIIPDEIEAKKAYGVYQKFSKLSREDQLDELRTADLIINNEFIADIYSPHIVSVDKASIVAEGILAKTEGDHFFRLNSSMAPDDPRNSGKRQANRVIVYTNQIGGDLKEVVQAIQESLLLRSPRYIEEAILLYEPSDGPAHRISLWP